MMGDDRADECEPRLPTIWRMPGAVLLGIFSLGWLMVHDRFRRELRLLGDCSSFGVSVYLSVGDSRLLSLVSHR